MLFFRKAKIKLMIKYPWLKNIDKVTVVAWSCSAVFVYVMIITPLLMKPAQPCDKYPVEMVMALDIGPDPAPRCNGCHENMPRS